MQPCQQAPAHCILGSLETTLLLWILLFPASNGADNACPSYVHIASMRCHSLHQCIEVGLLPDQNCLKLFCPAGVRLHHLFLLAVDQCLQTLQRGYICGDLRRTFAKTVCLGRVSGTSPPPSLEPTDGQQRVSAGGSRNIESTIKLRLAENRWAEDGTQDVKCGPVLAPLQSKVLYSTQWTSAHLSPCQSHRLPLRHDANTPGDT